MNNEDISILFLLESDNSEENLKSIQVKGFTTVTGKPGLDDKVRQMALVSQNIKFKRRDDLTTPDVSTLWLEIERENHSNILLANVYREWGNSDPSSYKNQSDAHKLKRFELLELLRKGKIRK